MTTSASSSVASSSEQALRSALKRDPSRLSDVLGPDKAETPGSSSPGGFLGHPGQKSYLTSPGYTNKVSFDTFEGNTPADTTMFSFTLKVCA